MTLPGEGDSDVLGKLRQIAATAECLYDNRLGWGDGREPYAPRAFWAALGIALGKDMAWIEETELFEEAELTRGAALHLLDEVDRSAEVDS